MKTLLAIFLVGCQAGSFECPEADEPEIVDVSEKALIAPGAVVFVAAECPADHHVVRGWCSLASAGATVEPMGAFGTDAIQVRGRTSTHHPQRDAWQCSGLADELVTLSAFVECRAGGGMAAP